MRTWTLLVAFVSILFCLPVEAASQALEANQALSGEQKQLTIQAPSSAPTHKGEDNIAKKSNLEGNWAVVDDKTGEKRAVLHFVIKDGTLSGTIESVYAQAGDTGVCSACPGDFKDKLIQGLEIVWGLKEGNDGEWDGGRILDAQMGKIYRVKMSMKGDKLYVRGYIGLAMLGRTQVWERA